MKKITENDAKKVQGIFQAYPFKTFQQQFQNIDKNILSQFFTDNLLNTLKNENYESYFIPEQAILTLQKNKWHSSIYNIPMAKILNFIINTDSKETHSIVEDTIDAFIERNSIRHISCRVDSSDLNNIKFLSQSGYYYVGESIKMCLKIPSNPIPFTGDFRIVKYCPEHRDVIKKIALTSHSNNYFFYDSNLDQQKTAEMFGKWTELCIDSLAEDIFVALIDNRVVGFLIFMVNKKLNNMLDNKIAILDFMAVKESLKGRKIGSGLLAYFIEAMRDKYKLIELRTMNNNFPAINLYQKFGFRLISSDFIFNKYIIKQNS